MRIKELLAWAASVCLAIGLGWGLFTTSARAEVICQPAEKLQELIANTNAKPVFMAQGADKAFSYVIVGDADTGEWIAFALTKKGNRACSVANGFNFSIVAPNTEEPKK
jgi:hypothetical protein